MRLAAGLILLFAAQTWCQCLYLPFGRSAVGFSYAKASGSEAAKGIGANYNFGPARVRFGYASSDMRASALLKARVGETIRVKAPRGTMEFKILEINAVPKPIEEEEEGEVFDEDKYFRNSDN